MTDFRVDHEKAHDGSQPSVRRLRFAAAVIFVILGVIPARAQTPSDNRPYLGLFRGDVDQSGQVLTASGSLGGGYDDDVLADALGGRVSPSASKGGVVRQMSAGLNYAINREGLSAVASAGSWFRYYPDFASPFVQAHATSVFASMRVRENTALLLRHSAAYEPYSFVAFFPPVEGEGPGDIEVPSFDVPRTRDYYMIQAAGIGFDQRIAQRAFWSANYTYRIRPGSGQVPQFTSQQVSTTLRFVLGRERDARLGYGYQEANFANGASGVPNHNAVAGVDFAWPHSASRRTTLSLDSGASASLYPSSWRYLINASARLTHDLGRTWNASLAYRRGMHFIETLQQPVFSDSATFQVTGLVSRRVQVRASAHAALGDAEFSSQFDMYRGSAGLLLGLTRYLALGVDYSNYHYRFDRNILLPAAVPHRMDRQSVRAQVHLWTLLFRRP